MGKTVEPDSDDDESVIGILENVEAQAERDCPVCHPEVLPDKKQRDDAVADRRRVLMHVGVLAFAFLGLYGALVILKANVENFYDAASFLIDDVWETTEE